VKRNFLFEIKHKRLRVIFNLKIGLKGLNSRIYKVK